ncbi:YIP1 family protein [Salinigranum salinum]|uniref:YIP1 family protein n=1 Tax=Salinigranum salinum TaxID=1364937 RepID=UPI0012608AEE|nr:YIP1 family protein [Salinigranum salinum]
MTTWVDTPGAGRERGPIGLGRAWVDVLVHPRRFFRTGVVPGDQAPGLVFAVVVALVYVATRFLLVPGSVPAIQGGPALSALLALLAVGLLVAPATLHLTAAVQTLLLMVLVRDRAGVSETVQTIAYATAPCALAGVPVPELRAVCALYGTFLLLVGLAEVHGTTLTRAAVAGVLPGSLVFGYAFGGFGAIVAVARAWTLI